MSRGLASALSVDAGASKLHPVVFGVFKFATGDLSLWNGIGEITVSSRVYTGAGDLVKISNVNETSKLRNAGMTFQLNGIPSDLIGQVSLDDYQGRPAILYFGTVASATRTVRGVYKLFQGRMDSDVISDVGTTATITMNVENALVALERKNERRLTPEDQKQDFPDDLGFDYVAPLQAKELPWG